ncbi:hypothetical protein A6A20_03630 [Volucribacter amazonae]|uniref:PapC-like C-terminal domain-containing protein n=1 Tax=Volucribacter amazonae TaxID=256731 RepID=A0A9X4SHK8_9PAST|nr:hypothetical protein [Volucribacter amazonae]
MSLEDTLRAREGNGRAYVFDRGVLGNRSKHQFQLSISQTFKAGWGYGYILGTSNRYWNKRKPQLEYQLGYSNNYKQLNYNVAFSQSRNHFGVKNNAIYVTLSYTFGSGKNRPYLSQTINIDRSNGNTFSSSLSGSLGEDYAYNYNIGINHQSRNNTSGISISNSYTSSLARIGGSWSRSNSGSEQWSGNISGGLVVHPKGVSLTPELGETFAIIHAKGATGAKINGTSANKIDYFGNGIVPYVDPYNVNYVGINPESLSNEVELSATEQRVIPRANNAILVNFATQIGQVAFFDLSNIDEDFPPIGTEVFNESGESVGVVAQGGRIYSRGLKERGKLHLSWGEKRCEFSYDLRIKSASESSYPLILPVVCKFD